VPASVAASSGAIAPAPGVAGAAQWTVLEWQTLPLQAIADAAGVADVLLPPVPAGQLMLVERITVSTDSAAASSVRVYLGAAAAINLVDGGANGNLDVSEYARPLLVPGGAQLRIRWSSMTAGAVASARVQYQAVSADS
jgi:hypothetical protein